MKASASTLCSVIAAVYAAAHLSFLAPSLEDIDSINFALGLRDFDVARHQPHPPGYPIYTALGRASLFVIDAAAPALDRVRADALALAVWSALAGALALVAAFALFRAVDFESSPGEPTEGTPLRRSGRPTEGTPLRRSGRPTEGTPLRRSGRQGVPLWATALLAMAPLFWISGLRPMSDLPGLAMALGAQALLLISWKERRSGVPGDREERRSGVPGDRATPRYLACAAFVAGLAVGMRMQTVWLTLPLLLAVAFRHRDAGFAWLCSRPLAALAVGGLAWAVPLVVASGGFYSYFRALGSQAGEDFAWVDMLWANPTPRRLAFALYETFVMPWGSVPLAVVIGIAAAAGAVIAAVRAPRALGLVSLAFVPYALFHLLFQETLHVRYALPLLPPIAWLAARGIASSRGAAPILGAFVCAFAAWTSLSGMVAYASEPHPAFRAIADMSAAAVAEQPGAVYAHYAVRRPLQVQAPARVTLVEPPRTNEWVDLLDYWRNGGTTPVWFLADPRRTDLALIDPQSRRDVRRYRWMAAERLELNGTRPLGVDWYRFHEPGWFAGEGWSLTPELGGMTRLTGTGVDRRPIEALVRRRSDPMTAIVGARHLGTATDGSVSLAFAVDGRTVDEWTLDPMISLNALRVLQLPAGSLDGPGAYARVAITARASHSAAPTPPVAIRQFDIQPESNLVHAFDEGWHEEEYENATGLRWRWSSGRSVIRVLPPQGVRLHLRGESPLKYFDQPPTVRVTAGERIVAERRPDDDFEWTIAISDVDARASDGRIAVETSPVYLPGRAEGTSDERQLGLRLFDIDVIPSRRD
jgi:hypothetical protein